MGTRGQNKTGYYISVLYALDMHYQLQSQQGLAPEKWMPAPKRRIDHFLHWTKSCMEALSVPMKGDMAEHLGALEAVGLSRIAEMLRMHLPKIDNRFDLYKESQGEEHPQARKIAAQLRVQQDEDWLGLLQTFPMPKTPAEAVALALGGLPIGYETVTRLLERLLVDYDAALLTPLQRFTLAAGLPPNPPKVWQDSLPSLSSLASQDLIQLNSLSLVQLEQLRQLDAEALALLALRERLPCSDERWQMLGTVLLTLKRDDVARIAEALSEAKRRVRLNLSQKEAQGAAYLLGYWPTSPALLLSFKDKLEESSWNRAIATSAELRRALSCGDLSPELLGCVRSWSRDVLLKARDLLRHEPVLSWREDSLLLADLDAQRSAAWLRLSEMFPSSVAYLSALLSKHYREALLIDWNELEPRARQIADHLRQRLLER